MIPHGKEIKVFTGSSNPDLADMICKNLGISLGKSTVTAFADGECSISINEPVRGVDVFIVQSTCKPVNDSLMELLVMIDALRRASSQFCDEALRRTEEAISAALGNVQQAHAAFQGIAGSTAAPAAAAAPDAAPAARQPEIRFEGEETPDEEVN